MSRPQHICIRPLNLPDIAQVLALELQGFPSHERASALRIEYRLTVCPELCSGLFIREFDTNTVNASELPDHSTIKNETLIAHVIGTKMLTDTVTDESMEVPSSFIPTMCNADGTLQDKFKTEILKQLEKEDQEKNDDNSDVNENNNNENSDSSSSGKKDKKSGHYDSGRTIGIHSVVVSPEYRGKKLASLLLKDYVQKMNQQYVADCISLLCKDKLVSFYSSVGFTDKGISSCTFGGEEWHDMTIPLEHEEDEED